MSDFSFCVIVKNEEKRIARCLAPLQKLIVSYIVAPYVCFLQPKDRINAVRSVR